MKKEVGNVTGWQPDYKASRDNFGRWTVTQSYRSSSIDFVPPRAPVVSLVPAVPLYDYIVRAEGTYFIFSCTWRLPDDEEAASDTETGASTDSKANANSYSVSRILKAVPLHKHPRLVAEFGVENMLQAYKLYELVIAGKIRMEDNFAKVAPVSIDDKEITFQQLQDFNYYLGEHGSGFPQYAELRNAGITDPLAPLSSYELKLASGVDLDPSGYGQLQAFISLSARLDGKSFSKVSEVQAVDGFGNRTISTSYTNEKEANE